MELESTTKIVRAILEAVPETRGDDYLLWFHVLSYESAKRDKDVLFVHYMPLGKFLKQAKTCKYPHYETVSRARRRLQEKYPELRATAETQAIRSDYEILYREYAKEDV